ncbi:MAG: hypothetical protein OXC60_16455 [Litoreibacter sp.]|nr:hypothetical protein [Litoreibacter sp.]
MEQSSRTSGLNQSEDKDEDAQVAGGETAPDEIDALEEQATRYQKSIDQNLTAFQGQLARLKDAIESQIAKINRGEIADADFGTIVKRVDPLMLVSIQQETKIHEKLAERVGRAGQQAINFRDAEAEIGRRLACLRRPGGDGEVRGEPT